MTHARAGMYAGAMIPLRALRGRAVALIAAATVVFATLAAFAERKAVLADAASRALQGPTFGLAIPVGVLALVSASLSGRRLDDALMPAALLGANRRVAAIGAAAGVAVVAGLLGLLSASCSALVAHGPSTAAGLADALTAGWIGALVAVSYALMFMAGSTFGARGGVRVALLITDLLIGPVSSRLSVLFPRSHGLNLLGAPDAAMGLPQPLSFAALLLLSVFFGLLMLRRVRP